VITNGALNLVDGKRSRFYADKLKDKLGPLKQRIIGLLIGGDTKNFKMDYDVIEVIADNLIKAAKECDAEILITTSRRTPKQIDELLRKRFSAQERCRLLVIANEENSEGIVEGILGLSDVVLVSEESISMISEAASSKSYTIVFTKGSYSDKRHMDFLKNLNDKGFIAIEESRNIYSSVSDVFNAGKKQAVLDDSFKLEEALLKIL